MFLLSSRQVQTDQYCNPIPGSPPWVLALVTMSLLSCGRWFLTHWRYPQSALDRWCLWLLGRSRVKPKLLDAGLPFVSLKLFSSNWSNFKNSQIRQNKTVFNRCFPKLQKPSINHPLVCWVGSFTVKFPHWCNGRSLSGMGLTRERWCCTGRWLRGLDTNTYQTSIKTDILL